MADIKIYNDLNYDFEIGLRYLLQSAGEGSIAVSFLWCARSPGHEPEARHWLNFGIPILSFVGPVYFAVNGSPVAWVLLWAAVWTSLRLIVEWQSVLAVSMEPDDQPPSWLDRHPSVSLVLVFMLTLTVFASAHVVIYWIVRSVI